MKKTFCVWIPAALLMLATALKTQTPHDQDSTSDNPFLTQDDMRIVHRAREILNSPEKWNRADTRVCRVKPCNLGCPSNARTFSLYCALKMATEEVKGRFDHRGAVMQGTRVVIDEIAVNRKDFQHRLEGYNNDTTTTFGDIQKVLRLLENRTKQEIETASQTNKQ